MPADLTNSLLLNIPVWTLIFLLAARSAKSRDLFEKKTSDTLGAIAKMLGTDSTAIALLRNDVDHIRKTVNQMPSYSERIDKLKHDIDEFYHRLRVSEKWTGLLRDRSHYTVNEFMKLSACNITAKDGKSYEPSQLPKEE